MNTAVATYLLYLTLSAAMTVYVGRTLHSSGRIFLVDSFHGEEPLADAVNHLLLVGFYLVNLGYIALAMKEGLVPTNLQGLLEVLSRKMGLVLLALGGMHFFNLYVFARMRRRALLHDAPPPLPASAKVGVVS